MKKIIIITIGLIGWANCNAQSDSSVTKFDFGIEVFSGIGTIYNNRTPIRDIQHISNEYRINWMGGIFGRYNISKKSAIELDILYNRINSFWGYNIDNIDNGKSYDNLERKIDYLSIPLTYQFTLKRFRINLGAQYSFLLNNFAEDHNYGFRGWDTLYTLTLHDLIKNDFSLTFYLSYTFLKKISIEGRFNQGLINTDDSKSGYKYHSRQFLIGLKYSVGKVRKKIIK